MARVFVAIDLGAESGRVMTGRLGDGCLVLEEVHRFPNIPVVVHGSRRWNLVQIWHEIRTGLEKVSRSGDEVAGLSCDSWGVDYVLFRRTEPMLGLPHQYRDARTEGAFTRAEAVMPLRRIFDETGIQLMEINTLFQMHAQVGTDRGLLEQADRFLNIGDYINYLLSGVPKAEVSLASTTQMMNPSTREWAKPLIKAFSLPGHILPEIIPSGTILGPVVEDLRALPGFAHARVIATCSHDTGAAVAAVPGEGSGWAYLSSGTWSLMGVERPEPIVNDASFHANFTNEAGFNRTVRFLKNIVGLFILQECRRDWEAHGQSLDYDRITAIAGEAEPARSLISPADPRFGKPGGMPAKIAAYCRETGQPEPAGPGATARCILESLALFYNQTLARLEEVTGTPIERLHIVGGGSKNRLFNQLIADATGRTVVAGPVEGTAIGNLLIQAHATGDLPDASAIRDVVRRSFPLETFQPAPGSPLAAARTRFAQLPATT
jgi:rhamnulokinase